MSRRPHYIRGKSRNGRKQCPPQTAINNRRAQQLIELVTSNAPTPNIEHPLAGLTPSERRSQRLLKLAEILAEVAKREALERTAERKKGAE